MNSKHKASVTVEALLILPAVLTFFIFICRIMELFYVHSEIGGIVNKTGNKIVSYSYAYERFASDLTGNKEAASLAASGAASELMLRTAISKSGAYKEISGLICELSRVNLDGEVRLSAVYTVKFPIKLPFLSGVLLKNSFYSKLYTGCNHEPSTDEFVYITRHGKVYHTIDNCRALKVTVTAVSEHGVKDKRNNSGAKYYPCEKCGKQSPAGEVYITPYGNRYHTDWNCYEINTEIFKIPKNQVGGRRKCLFCP